MSDPAQVPSRHPATSPSRRGQSLVEFALVLPLLLVLFLGLADFGRVFHSAIVAEAAARNAAEVVAEEYRGNPPGGSLADPAPPGDPAYYQPLHDLGAFTVCNEMRTQPSAAYDPDTRRCHLPDADPATYDWMPVIQLCVHDGEDPLCGQPAYGATIPDPECSALLAPISPAMEGGVEDSRYVEVRICYLFRTIVSLPILSIGDIWLQRDRTFTVADYPIPTPSPPPEPPPPSGTELPSDSPTPSASPSPTESTSPSPSGSPTPAPESTPAPEPTPEPTPAPTPEPTPEPTP